jgi:MoaA/NifB/PqqE/SkfB family radical SAM enzyme
MLLRSGLNDMRKIPAFSENAGISQTVISSLSLVVSPAMEKESVLASDKEEYRELVDSFHEIRKDAEKRGTEISFNIVSPLMEGSFCTENVERALVIGSDGCVSPCVMAQIPVGGDNFHYFRGNRQTIKKLSFGNINDEALNTIWHKKEYKNFIRTLIRRGTAPFCQNCLKRFILDPQAESISYWDHIGDFFP